MVQAMPEQDRMLFLTRLNSVSKDAVMGVVLAFFLGTFGGHRFYLGETGLGILYLLFFWTGIPALVSLVECFLMPERVRQYNAAMAAMVYAQVRGAMALHPGLRMIPSTV